MQILKFTNLCIFKWSFLRRIEDSYDRFLEVTSLAQVRRTQSLSKLVGVIGTLEDLEAST